VAVGWRPYYYGRWISYPRYGWTWVGLDLFSWPTHHYGRWGFSAGTWFWIPGNRWAPAYVSWAYAPGYVSWCPLGFNNRPVIAINLNFGSRYYSPWHAWTVVRAGHFGGAFVHHRPVFIHRFDVGRRPVFVTRPAAPAYRDVAIPRGSAPIRWAGARSLPPEGGSHQNAGRSGNTRGTVSSGSPWLPPSGGSRDTARPRDNYFTRGGDRGEHIVSPAAPNASPSAVRASSAQSRDTATSRAPRPNRAVPDADISGQRAIPRGSQTPAFGAPAQRTAPEGPVRRIEPRAGDDAVYAPRQRIGRDPRPYSVPSPPMTQDPRMGVPSYDRRGPGRLEGPRELPPNRGPAPGRVEGPDRGEMAVPRGQGGFQRPSYGGQGAPTRVAPPQSAPPPQRSAPAERSRPSGSQSTGQATPRRGGRGGN
jgi:hypothetical protein